MKVDKVKVDKLALMMAAETVKQRAYAPYSSFRVGAALLTKSGRIYAACNVENRSYGLTVCAERNAVAQAVAHGETDFVAIMIASDANPPAPPCGACREVMAEFKYDLPITLLGKDDVTQSFRLDKLLPEHFELKKKKKR